MSGIRNLSLDQINRRVYAVSQEALQMSKRGPSLRRAGALPIARKSTTGEVVGGVVLFRVGLPITEDNGGARWLAMHLAACFGRAGHRYEDRMRWVIDHEDLWRRIDADPLANLEWSGPAVSDPWSALAAALEWAAFRTAGFGMPSRLPIPLSLADVSAIAVDTMPVASVEVPRGILDERWAGVQVRAGMVVKEDAPGVYATHAATAGALAHFLRGAAELVRSIPPEPPPREQSAA